MGVDLRVVQPRRRLAERGDRQSFRVGVQAAAVRADSGCCPVPLQGVDRRLDRGVVRVEQTLIAGERPPRRQRFRGRDRGIETGHRPHNTTIGQGAVDQRVAERDPRVRVATREEPFETLSVNRA